MIGAILGDMIGAPYEFDRGGKTKDFLLFVRDSQFTDDSVMTVAVAEALMNTMGQPDDKVKMALVQSMQAWGRKYPYAGYGGRFSGWLREMKPKPYGSYGNGSVMRVSAAGWLYPTLEDTQHAARLTAEVTHNHPEGIKGAEATASAIFLARTGHGKDEIRDYITSEFGYDLSRSCDEIRPTYHHVESCQKTVPEAITAFLEGADFEDVIRTAVSLGGDCDTLTCIAGSIAEAFYSIPDEMAAECRKRLPEDMLAVLDRFEEQRLSAEPEFHDPFLDGNELIEQAISAFHTESTKERLSAVLESIRQRMHEDGHFMIPVIASEDGTEFTFRTVQTNDEKEWLVAFTSPAEFQKGQPSQIVSNFIDAMLKACLNIESPGFIINPWGESFMLTAELIDMIIKADGGVEYSVPDGAITPELLEDGSFLKKATEICNRNRTQLNMIKLLKILRDSWVWIPCTAVMSDTDYAAMEKLVMEAKDNLDSLVGMELTSQDSIRMVPDILQNGEDFFFPVFTTAEEMGDYG
ncbi:MAG: ADP-ribosylglycohydrolase family protein, partial [Lachnospiraceae bacterium]|nr:ADP-ribosylglycohydrolase family protein [Lachnospiraceae bacterium]